MTTRRFGRYSFECENEDKVLFPGDGISKGELIEYYERVSEFMLPHIEGRALTLKRHPDGIGEDGFFQKQVGDYFPEWIERADLKKEGGRIQMTVANNQATLAYLANQGAIELHAALGKAATPDVPDTLVVDFDPSDDDFEKVRAAAFAAKELLEEFELTPFVKTTGSRGVHVVVALKGEDSFDDVRDVAQKIAKKLADAHEDLTVEQRKNKRGKRVFVDYLRNAYGQTAVAPYSVRARKGAPVATPIDWDELKDKDTGPQSWTIKNILRRLAQKGDPWKGMRQHASSLKKTRARLDV